MRTTVTQMIEFLRPQAKPRRERKVKKVSTGVGKMSLRRKLPHRVR